MSFLPNMKTTPTGKLVTELKIYVASILICFSCATTAICRDTVWVKSTGSALVFALLASVFAYYLTRGLTELGSRQLNRGPAGGIPTTESNATSG